MSRLFDDIRTDRETRSMSSVNGSGAPGQMDLLEHRISPLAKMYMDLTVYGRSGGNDAFYEPAKAVSGNANGGVFLLAIPVGEGQDLVLFNTSNSREQICNVIGVRIRDVQTSEVSVRFADSNSDFWSLTPAAQSA